MTVDKVVVGAGEATLKLPGFDFIFLAFLISNSCSFNAISSSFNILWSTFRFCFSDNLLANFASSSTSF
eukprot:m.102692 g.102692  ORF g.102692 m.102692 type:complete len:69 (+) comp9083_c2_seq7:559-765(+)